ncbi:MAG TPA: GNAT family N-acetyltransferase [Thermopolyspora sp.]|jgi:Predicted acetyltransferase
MTAAKIADNPEAARFEVRIDGRLAGFAQYQLRGGTIVFTHTEIQPEFEGKGLGSVLARAALDGARDTGLTVVPECLFIRGYIESHPEYTELLESR